MKRDLSVLKKKKELFERYLKKTTPILCENNKLKEACEYALLNGGKRFRPIIVLSIGNDLPEKEHLYCAATAVEYFHTASLIADDLPCMDNDNFRRDRPSLHVAFGETTALLASYGLISEAYNKIYEASNLLKSSNLEFAVKADTICVKALEIASEASGLKGATLGQYYDLFPKDQTREHLMKIIDLKTITLFQVAFGFGWIFNGKNLNRLSDVNKLAYHFGLAFQIADDLNDLIQDEKENTTSNIAAVFGKEASSSLFYEELEAVYRFIDQLKIDSDELLLLIEIMKDYALASLVSA